MNRVPPELLAYDNEMEDFMAVRRGIVFDELPEIPSFPDKAEAQFMQDVESMRERNKTNKSEWTWKTLGWLLLGFGLAVWMFYEGLN